MFITYTILFPKIISILMQLLQYKYVLYKKYIHNAIHAY